MNTSDIPDAVRRLADRLQVLHGAVNIRKESGGHHLYMASPVCLEKDGRRELNQKPTHG